MIQSERENLATKATARIGAIAVSPDFALFGDALYHKFLLLMSAIDTISHASSKPVLITSLIAGIDILVCHEAPGESGEVASERAVPIDIRALLPLDSDSIEALGRVCAEVLPEMKQGAQVFSSADGTHYIAFRTCFRDESLKAMGLSDLMPMASNDGMLQ